MSGLYTFLFVALILYYIGMIAYDIYFDKMAKKAEAEKMEETEIDISDEAKTFTPNIVSRDGIRKADIPENSDKPEDNKEEGQENHPSEQSGNQYQNPSDTIKRPHMTGWKTIEELQNEAEKYVESGEGDFKKIFLHIEENINK